MSDSNTSCPKYVSTPYLSNTKGPVELMGLGSLLSPLPDKISSQRATMFSAHLPQTQVIRSSEQPKIMTGFENIVGAYEYNTTERTQDIQIEAIIPKFQLYNGISESPYTTVIYRGLEDGTIDYFNLETYTFRSEGYGYRNKLMNLGMLSVGSVIEKDVKLMTSPSHKGNSYCMGTNAKVAYLGIPQVAEDAFVISQSLANKLAVTGVGRLEISINPYQVPKNLYGTDGLYKFLPDIGQEVNEDGLLAAICTPTENSFLYDLSPSNLSRVNYLHDSLFYVPLKSRIIDIDVYINSKMLVDSRIEFFQQALDYQQALNEYYSNICNTYVQLRNAGKTKLSSKFHTLVRTSMAILSAYKQRIPGLQLDNNLINRIKLVRRKEPIQFIHIVVKYIYPQDVKPGMKLTGTCGNKGVISSIFPDDWMPVDEEGQRADLIIDPASVPGRMNPAQWYIQFFNRGARLLEQRLPNMEPLEAYNEIIWYLKMINPKWAELVDSQHPTDLDKQKLVDETIRSPLGIVMQISPMQEGIDQNLIIEMSKKYNIHKSCVNFKLPTTSGYRSYTSKKPVMIGDIYVYHLYKIPHQRVVNVGYTSHHGVPMRGSRRAKYNHPYSPTTIRWGEDEVRNLIMTVGAETTARMLGMYGNSPEALEELVHTLMDSPHPGQLHRISKTDEEIFKSNNIVNITKHMFSCLGIDISPEDEVQPEVTEYDDLWLSDSLKQRRRSDARRTSDS